MSSANLNSLKSERNPNYVYCELELSSECLKIKTEKNIKEFWGNICNNCRNVRKIKNNSEYYKKRYQRKKEIKNSIN